MSQRKSTFGTSGRLVPRPAEHEHGLSPEATARLRTIAQEAEEALHRLLSFWLSMEDPRGGHWISVDARGGIDGNAPKTLVFSARIAWTFATASRRYGDASYAAAAQKALAQLDRFRDPHDGGYWASIDRNGVPVSRAKHIYGQSFALYALSAAALCGDESRKRQAVELFSIIESRARGGSKGLYVESFDGQWNETPNEDRALGETPARHSADTHLHLIEAYGELLRATGDAKVAAALSRLVDLFLEIFLSPDGRYAFQKIGRDGAHLNATIWPGHDIEASWLLDDVSMIEADIQKAEKIRRSARALARGAISLGMLDNGAWRERVEDNDAPPRILWWVHAEAALGLAILGMRWQDEDMLERLARTWSFIRNCIIDPATGDWRLRVTPSGVPDAFAPRIVHWKDPYHQARACMELAARIRGRLTQG